MLRVIEETVPVQKIWLDTAEQKETPLSNFEASSDETVMGVITTLFKDMITRKGMTAGEAQLKLVSTDPFHHFPHLIEQLSKSEN